MTIIGTIIGIIIVHIVANIIITFISTSGDLHPEESEEEGGTA